MKLDDYLKLDYSIGFQYDKEDGYFVEVFGLDGCMSQGDTFEEACWMIVDALKGWLEIALEDEDNIPTPTYKAVFWDDYTAIMLLRFVRNIASVYEGLL